MQRRELKFDHLGQVIDDIQDLIDRGYQASGKWNLSQTCHHLADWMEFPVRGFLKPPMVVGWMLWMVKITMGRKLLKKTLETGTMKAGTPTDPRTVHLAAPDGETPQLQREALERVRNAVAEFQQYQGPIHPSPVFGPMDKPTAEALQCVHCAHHLSFLLPDNA